MVVQLVVALDQIWGRGRALIRNSNSVAILYMAEFTQITDGAVVSKERLLHWDRKIQGGGSPSG